MYFFSAPEISSRIILLLLLLYFVKFYKNNLKGSVWALRKFKIVIKRLSSHLLIFFLKLIVISEWWLKKYIETDNMQFSCIFSVVLSCLKLLLISIKFYFKHIKKLKWQVCIRVTQYALLIQYKSDFFFNARVTARQFFNALKYFTCISIEWAAVAQVVKRVKRT